jgi:hypothetical protein
LTKELRVSVDTIAIAMAAAWRPQPGQNLTGAVAHREIRTTEYGTYPVIYIADADSDSLVAVHAFHQTLRDGFKELAPQRGQFVSITYVGEKESKTLDAKGSPRTYHHYVVVDPDSVLDSAELDWDSPDF